MRFMIKAGEKRVAPADLGGYQIIYADPPWSYNDKNCTGSAAAQYQTMDINDIASLPVGQMAAPNATLFMWGTYPLLQEMLRVGHAWGFEYKSIAFQWVKHYSKSGAPFFGLGKWTRGNTEGCFLFVKGKPRRVSASVSQLVDETVIDAPLTTHSTKPTMVRDRIVDLMGDLPRVELFARSRAPGWDAFGNEVDSNLELTDE